jgi:hypothetical protein
MTSEQLYELCKPHIGKPYWQSGCFYDWNQHGPKRAKRWYCCGDTSISDMAAEALILGAAVAWLAKSSGTVTLRSGVYHSAAATYGDGEFAEIDGKDFLLAAVLAACEAVQA